MQGNREHVLLSYDDAAGICPIASSSRNVFVFSSSLPVPGGRQQLLDGGTTPTPASTNKALAGEAQSTNMIMGLF